LSGKAQFLITTYDSLSALPFLGNLKAIIAFDAPKSMAEYQDLAGRSTLAAKAVIVLRRGTRSTTLLNKMKAQFEATETSNVSFDSLNSNLASHQCGEARDGAYDLSDAAVLELMTRFTSTLPHDAYWHPKLLFTTTRVRCCYF
jgi:hypothetical protein